MLFSPDSVPPKLPASVDHFCGKDQHVARQSLQRRKRPVGDEPRRGRFAVVGGVRGDPRRAAQQKRPPKSSGGQFVCCEAVTLSWRIFPTARGFGGAEVLVHRVHDERDEETPAGIEPLCLHRSPADVLRVRSV